MQHRFDECSVQLQRAWQCIFVTAILLVALPAFAGTLASKTVNTAAAAIDPFDAPRHNNALNHINFSYRANPHPPIVFAAVKNAVTVNDLPNLAFASTLNATLKAQPYQVLPVVNTLRDVNWTNTNTNTVNDWTNLRARLSNTTTTAAVSQLITLFQPNIKPEPKQWVIMLDAGHGGSDPGSEAPNGLVEKELTLDIAQRASQFLSELDNVKVVLTRDGDHGMSRWSRVNKVKRSKADVVISLHFNHLPQNEVNLVETYYAGQRNIMESQAKQLEEQGKQPVIKMGSGKRYSFTQQSARLANIMQNRVYNEVRLDNPLAADAGVKQDTLFILTRSFTPGVLIELSCLSNEIEAKKLASEAYRTRLAASLADGIRDYLHSELEQKSDSDIEV